MTHSFRRALLPPLALLLLTLLLAALVSCAPSPSRGEGDLPPGTDASGLPIGLSFAGQDLSVLVCRESTADLSAERAGLPVSKLRYLAAEAVKERLGVTQNLTFLSNLPSGDSDAALSAIESSVSAGDPLHALFAASASTTVRAAAKGLLRDLPDAPFFTRGDGTESFRSALINDRLYFCFGAFEPSLAESLFTVHASIPAMERLGIDPDALLETARAGGFTLAYLMELGEAGKRTETADPFFSLSLPQAFPLYLALGGGTIDTSRGPFALHADFAREKPLTLLSPLETMRREGTLAVSTPDFAELREGRECFRVLTLGGAFLTWAGHHGGGETLLLPLPKSGARDDTYRSPISEEALVWSSPCSLQSKTQECANAVLSVLLDVGERDALPAIYEAYYGVPMGEDLRSEVFSDLFASFAFDFGYAAGECFDRLPQEVILGAVERGYTSSVYESVHTALSEALRPILTEWNDAFLAGIKLGGDP